MIKVINHSALLLGLEWLFAPNLYRELKCLNLHGLMLLVCGMVGAHIVRVLALQSCASLCCQVTQATGWGGRPCDIDFRENTCVAPHCPCRASLVEIVMQPEFSSRRKYALSLWQSISLVLCSGRHMEVDAHTKEALMYPRHACDWQDAVRGQWVKGST